MLQDISIPIQRGDILLLSKAAAFVDAESAAHDRGSPGLTVGQCSNKADDDTSTTVSSASLGSNEHSNDQESNKRVRMLLEAAVALDIFSPQPGPGEERPNKKIRKTRKGCRQVKSKVQADLGGRLQKKRVSPTKRRKVVKTLGSIAKKIPSKTRGKRSEKKKPPVGGLHQQDSFIDLTTCDANDGYSYEVPEGELYEAPNGTGVDDIQHKITALTARLQERKEANEKLKMEIKEMELTNTEIRQWCTNNQGLAPPPPPAPTNPAWGLVDFLQRQETQRQETQRQRETQTSSETLPQLQLLLNLAQLGQGQQSPGVEKAPNHTMTALQTLVSGTPGMSQVDATTASLLAHLYKTPSYGEQVLAGAPLSSQTQSASSVSLQDMLCRLSPAGIDHSRAMSMILQQRQTESARQNLAPRPTEDSHGAVSLSAVLLNALGANQQAAPAPIFSAESLQKQVDEYQAQQQQHQAQALYAVLQNLAAR